MNGERSIPKAGLKAVAKCWSSEGQPHSANEETSLHLFAISC